MTAEVRANTLFVTAEGAYLRMRELSLQVVVDGKTRLSVPLHHLHAVAMMGRASVSTSVLERCVDAGISVTFLTSNGKLVARVDAPVSGNVLLRRSQFRNADDPAKSLEIARSFVAGKLNNCRSVLMHASREDDEASVRRLELRTASARVRQAIVGAAAATTLDELRGQEGIGSRSYFGAFSHLLRQDSMRMPGRNRRPPRDPVNAVLSFVYALLLNDCISALTAAGLDPAVGYLHSDRPGRPGLALDLMEEFRPLLADRTVLAIINRKQVTVDDFGRGDGGSVMLTPEARRAVIAGYHERCGQEVKHPLLEQSASLSQFPFIQARLLARHIRGDLAAYPPCVLR
jgi:CRISPR-associated protein Cas1